MSSSANPLDPLSPREREVLLLFLQGLSLKEIAHRLGISISRAMGCKRRTLKKLRLSSDVHLVVYCLRQGILIHEDAA